MQKEYLKSYINKDILLSVFADYENPHDFYAGFVVACSDEYLIINAVDKYGISDGLRLIVCDYIFAVDENAEYCNKLQKLFELKKQQKICYNFEPSDLSYSLLSYAKANNCPVELCDDEFRTGFVVCVDENTLTMRLLDEFGKDEGLSYFSRNNLNNLTCGNRRLNDMALLYEARKQR